MELSSSYHQGQGLVQRDKNSLGLLWPFQMEMLGLGTLVEDKVA